MLHLNLSSFLRFTGVCSIISGILFLSLAIWYNTSLGQIGAYVNLIGMVFLLFGLVGIYLYQMNAVGVFVFITFVLFFIGTALWMGFGWVEVFVIPALEEIAPEILADSPPALLNIGMFTSLIFFFVGLLLFALVTAWKGIHPRGAAILLVLVPFLDFIPFGSYVGQPLAGVALIWLGYSIWKGKYEEVGHGN